MSVPRHQRDLMQGGLGRLLAWDLPAGIGLLSLFGSPGVGLFGGGLTCACWSVSLAGPSVGHVLNARRSDRRRSPSSAAVFGLAAVSMGIAALGMSMVPANVMWIAVAATWAYWSLHDRRHPERRYRASPTNPPERRA
jgi:hypothetical protein